jgi:hypothetical protein
MMLNCREASRLASESLDHRLPMRSLLAMRIHLLICRFCRRYLRQIRLIREMLHLSDEELKGTSEGSTLTLSREAKERIRERIGGRD